jgi:hypothetical protein
MESPSQLPIFESPSTSPSPLHQALAVGDADCEHDCPDSPVPPSAFDADATSSAANIPITAPVAAAVSSPVPQADPPASPARASTQLQAPCSTYHTKGLAAAGFSPSDYMASFKILRLSFHK